jgi:hypothetical protein
MCTFNEEELLPCRSGKPNENRNIFQKELVAQNISPIIEM